MTRDVKIDALEVTGASLHYEVRGTGPVLAMIGAPMGSSGFAALAEEMSSDHTVVTYDPRGTGQTTVTDRTRATTPELLAEDVHQILSAVTDDPVVVLGSSGGAVTGLALVAAHPDQVSVLIAHEPPVMTLLADAAKELERTEQIHETYLRSGAEAAMRQFMLTIGVRGDEGARHFAAAPAEPAPAPTVPQTDEDFFFANQIRATAGYAPDLDALAGVSTRIVVGVGANSAGQLAHRTGLALADRLGLLATEFPGGHGGFSEAVPGFAHQLRDMLRSLT
jgi:pimeloyl-ACP methyl ester carboxylesterase